MIKQARKKNYVLLREPGESKEEEKIMKIKNNHRRSGQNITGEDSKNYSVYLKQQILEYEEITKRDQGLALNTFAEELVVDKY